MMTVMKVRATFLVGILSLVVGLVALVGCGSSGANGKGAWIAGEWREVVPGEAQFKAHVLQKMPNLELKAHHIGRPVVRSPLFRYVYGLPPDGSDEIARKRLREYMAYFEEDGMKPVEMIVDRAYWSEAFIHTHFPGCAPGSCVKAVDNLTFFKASRERSELLDGKIISKEIAHSVINGIAYRAKLTVWFDKKGRVRLYSVQMSRDPVNEAEKRYVKRAYGGTISRKPQPVLFYIYDKQVAAGVVQQSDYPEINGSISRLSRLRGF